MTDTVIALIVTMVFSAFFSGMEIAFVSSNRLLAEMDTSGKTEAQTSGTEPQSGGTENESN